MKGSPQSFSLRGVSEASSLPIDHQKSGASDLLHRRRLSIRACSPVFLPEHDRRGSQIQAFLQSVGILESIAVPVIVEVGIHARPVPLPLLYPLRQNGI
jgi:hypothetical protein